MKQTMRVLTSQATNEWYTPLHIIERARAVLGGIDLDPASCDAAQAVVRAANYYTVDTPLYRPWAGRVWLNPPFDATPIWVKRLEGEYVAGGVTAAVLLVNSAPGYAWWEDLWRNWPVVMLRERLRFIDSTTNKPSGQAKKGQTLAYFGPDVRAFFDGFRDLGRCLLPDAA